MKLVIELSEDLFIPFPMEVSTCVIIAHPPTDDDLNKCQWILLSDDFYWDTSKNLFKIYSMEEEIQDKLKFSPLHK